MNPKAVKLISIAALFLMFGWWFAAKGLRWSVQDGGYMEVLSVMVCLAALTLVAVAAYGRKYYWAAGFTAMAVLFNPFALITLSRVTFLVLDAVCIAVLLFSVAQSWTERRSQPALDKPPNS
ncbi:MAG: DUF6804 family protein [Candidatus Acidiferrum sp.]